MICKECKKEVKSINGQHLKKCSKFTIGEYLKKYPDSQLIDEDVKKSFGLPGDKNNNWQGGKTKKSCTECAKKLSKNNKSGLCRSCSRKGEKNPFFNKTHTVKTRKKMAKSNALRDPETYKPGIASPEKRKVMYKDRWKNMSLESRESMIRNFIIAGAKSSKKSYETKIENIVFEILSELDIFIHRNYQIGIFNVDFLINDKFIIECFGDYWHCNPKLYEANFFNKSMKITAKEKWKKDLKKKNILKGKEYKIISFWESDILSKKSFIKNKIIKFLNL